MFYQVNGIKIHVTEAGPQDGRPIVFLHGFPDFWYGWKNQIGYFAALGFRVIVPDQRGYNLSDKPRGLKAYRTKHLMEDICDLVITMDLENVYLVGHDWGGIVAWMLGIYHPQQFRKIIILNAPHPGSLRKGISLSQVFQSWYIYFFQIPGIPEWLCRRNNFRFLSRSMVKSSLPGTFHAEDLERYRQAWKGSLTSMINWYRAMRLSSEFRQNVKQPRMIELPVLLIWGKMDVTLNFRLAKASISFCRNGQLISFPDATHWLQHEKSAEINRAILEFVNKDL